MPFPTVLPSCDHSLNAIASLSLYARARVCARVCVEVGKCECRGCLSAMKVSVDQTVEETHNQHSLPAAHQQGNTTNHQTIFTLLSQSLTEMSNPSQSHCQISDFEEHNLFAPELVVLPSSDVSSSDDLN